MQANGKLNLWRVTDIGIGLLFHTYACKRLIEIKEMRLYRFKEYLTDYVKSDEMLRFTIFAIL